MSHSSFLLRQCDVFPYTACTLISHVAYESAQTLSIYTRTLHRLLEIDFDDCKRDENVDIGE